MNRGSIKYFGIVLLFVFLSGCTISYRFNGATIDYTKLKTLTIETFPNRARMVYVPLSQNFTQGLQDIFTRQTRLNMVPNGGDIQIEGEITGYDIQDMGVSATDSYRTETRLTITVQVRYTNNVDPSQSMEQSFSANKTYDNVATSLNDAQDQLVPVMIEELADMIFNATVGRW
jgi:hypothetical protein